ncbi:MAG: hypothetical protein ACRCYD_12090, partial [Plesiomonas sp.]
QAGLANLPRNVQLVPLSTLVYAKSNTSLTSPVQKPAGNTSSGAVTGQTTTKPSTPNTANGLYQPGPIIEQPADKSPAGKSPTESKPHNPALGNSEPTPAIPPANSEQQPAQGTSPTPEPEITLEILGMSESPDINQLDLLPATTSKPPYIKLPLMRGQRED